MKEAIFTICGVICGVIIALLTKNHLKQPKPLDNPIDDDTIIKDIYAKNPAIKSKQDVLKELNRYRNDN